MATNSGYAAGIARESAAKRLAWALSGAPLRKRDFRLTPIGAVAAARELRDSVSEKMRSARLDPEDAIVAPVFARADMNALEPHFRGLSVEAEAQQEIEIATTNASSIAISAAIFIVDRESGCVFGHARPFIVEDGRALRLSAQAVRVFGRHIRRALAQKGAKGVQL